MRNKIGRYEIKSQLPGRLQCHFHAYDPVNRRDVAIKTLPSDPALHGRYLSFYQREARLRATITYPTIPKLYDTVFAGSDTYLVYEFVPDAQTLQQVLEAHGAGLPAKTVIGWAIQLGDVLTYLHNHQPRPVIFLDLKPSNVLLDGDGRIWLTDFDIATDIGEDGQPGAADKMGTEGYAPPEQYLGVAAPANDIFSLGATLHHLLTGIDPNHVGPFTFHKRPISRYNPTVTADLEKLVMKSLAIDPAERFPSIAAMQAALAQL